MDVQHSEEEVRRWGSTKGVSALHEYMDERHNINQDPHLDASFMDASPRTRITKRSWFLPAVSGALLVIFGGIYLAVNLFSAPASDGISSRFSIEPGTPLTDIVRSLEDEGYIRNYWSVAFLLRMRGREGDVKAGSFMLSPTMSPAEIVAVLTDVAPAQKDIEVTVPEGLTASETALRIAEAGVIDDAAELLDALVDLSDYDFVERASCSAGDNTPCDSTFASLEGYLFPDTYRFDENSDVQAIADRFLKNFSVKFDESLRAEAAARGVSLRDLVTIASMIEEESLYDTDRPLIAGIINQRIERGMLLQIDATVLYAQEQVIRAIPGARFESVDREITFTDLEIDSPYNTYKYGGLPPGPIASPGLPSLIGALRPEASDFLYYLHDPQGETHFARTLEEHISNRNRYLK